ncbi:FtsX-like permease family protein [Candidatus Dojkabacteria bacterium]|jgi:ABC-type antimicrobial peptide transport system permease subunit|nr:FtsX-like permease family protein [Candidatus Dojkabacteria bacterium]
MKLFSFGFINFKKLRIHKGKALFLIIPMTVLVAIMVIVASQIKNIQQGIDESIFGTIKTQSTVLLLTKETNTSTTGRPEANFNFNNTFTPTDISTVSSVSNVVSATLNSEVPITNIISTDLFSDISYKLSNLAELDSSSASVYTDKDFSYVSGQAIPIILNANTFSQSYEDWGGKSSITIDFTQVKRPTSTSKPTAATTNPIESLTPIKTKAIEYTKEDLIGKTFTIQFGGLDEIKKYSVAQESGAMVFTKISNSAYKELIATRKEAISTYWKYSKISKPQTYTFVVAGIIDDTSNRNSYIPSTFANVLMQNYVNNQLKAVTTKVPVSLLSSTYTGLTFNGTELTSASSVRGFRVSGGMGGGFAGIGDQSNTTSYSIPGLVIQTDEQTGDVVGVATNTNIYKNSIKTSDIMTVKINDVSNRTQVITDLNAKGYAFTDSNKLDMFSNIQSILNKVSSGLTIFFVILSASVIILTMSKFVSESVAEIGVFRAIGMKKISVLLLFLMQSVLYSVFGYIFGIGIGIGLNILLATVVSNWFQNMITTTVGQSFGVINQVSSSLFTNLDISSIGMYSAILAGIVFVISIIPAFRASSISPMEAIKGEK